MGDEKKGGIKGGGRVEDGRKGGRKVMSVFFFQAEDGIRDTSVTGVQTCALPIWNIWSDWVKIGEKNFWGQNFHKVADLTVLSTFMQVLPRSE